MFHEIFSIDLSSRQILKMSAAYPDRFHSYIAIVNDLISFRFHDSYQRCVIHPLSDRNPESLFLSQCRRQL